MRDLRALLCGCGEKKEGKILLFRNVAASLHSLTSKSVGAIAQLVEQRTENPCVPGSIPGGTTRKERVAASTLVEAVIL